MEKVLNDCNSSNKKIVEQMSTILWFFADIEASCINGESKDYDVNKHLKSWSSEHVLNLYLKIKTILKGTEQFESDWDSEEHIKQWYELFYIAYSLFYGQKVDNQPITFSSNMRKVMEEFYQNKDDAFECGKFMVINHKSLNNDKGSMLDPEFIKKLRMNRLRK